jgi:drug/metabolite transporter (DMT)-like permease
VATFFAYLAVVLIWATTPLAIQWSSDSLSFMAAVLLRMMIALTLALAINSILQRKFFAMMAHWKIYLAASIGIFPNMPLVYWAAQFIPSGLVAVIFALSPFVTGLMTLLLLKENPFGVKRLLALLLALLGLVVIFYRQLQLDIYAAWGIGGIFLSCFLFSFSSVWVKKLTLQNSLLKVDALHQATGAFLFSLPGLLLTWWWFDGSLNVDVSLRSGASIVYLALIGSLLGAVLFFYILQRLAASSVALITLMTPVLAILLGWLLADETLALQTLLGVLLVLVALLIYIPWSLQAWRQSLARGFIQCLRARALTPEEYPQGRLQDIKDDFLRYK